MFFATPHRGGNNTLVKLGKFVSRIVQKTVPGGKVSNTLLETLDKKGFPGEELRQDWKEQLDHYRFVSFHEDRHTVVFGKDVGQVS